MANVYSKEIQFIKDNIDFLNDENLAGLYKKSIESKVEWPRVLYVLLKTNMEPFSGMKIIDAWIFYGFDYPEYEVEIPFNITSCNITELTCKTLKFENPDTTLTISNSTMESLILPEHFDASGNAKENYIGENTNTVVAIPIGMSMLGNIIDKSQYNLQVSMDVKTASRIKISPDLFVPGLTGHPGWNMDSSTVIIY